MSGIPRKVKLASILRTQLKGLLVGVVAVDPPSIAATTAANTPVIITGLTTSHVVVAVCQGDLEAGLSILATYASAANTLQIRLYNTTGVAIDPVSRNWGYIAWIP